MRSVTYYVATSLDGLIAGPDGSWDAFDGEGDHMEIVLDEFGDAIPAHAHAALGTTPSGARFDAVIMGWRTFEPALAAGVGSPYPHLEQIVASRRAREVDPGVRLTADPIGEVRRLRKGDGAGVWIAGGGELAGQLVEEIDELVLKVNPVVLGDGVPLFGGAAYATRRFERRRVREFRSGVTIMEFDRRR